MVGIAQLVSAPDCGSGGQGFESLYPPLNLMGYRQAVRHSTLTAALVGSNPTSPVRAVEKDCKKYGALAQSVEHLTFNQVVRGSNPRCFTKKNVGNQRSFLFYRKDCAGQNERGHLREERVPGDVLIFNFRQVRLYVDVWILAKALQNYLLFLEEFELVFFPELLPLLLELEPLPALFAL